MTDSVRPSLSPADRLRAHIYARKAARTPGAPLPASPASPANRLALPTHSPDRAAPASSKLTEAAIPAHLATTGARQAPSQATPGGQRPKTQTDLVPAKRPKSAEPRPSVPAVDSTVKVLDALELPSLQHMLLCVPSAYSDCRFPVKTLLALSNGFRGLFLLRKTGVVEAVDASNQVVDCNPYASLFDAPYSYWANIRQLRICLVDDDGAEVWVTSFSPLQMRKTDPRGLVLIEGELQSFGRKRFITSTSEPPPEVAGRVWVRYVCPGAPSEVHLRALVGRALQEPDAIQTTVHSLVTSSLLSEKQLLSVAEQATGQIYESLAEFFEILHRPESPSEGDLAAAAARAMGVAGICSAARSANTRTPHVQAALNVSSQVVASLIDSQPETLTSDQMAAINGVVTALRSPAPLNGLISGDTGTGKTMVYLIPALAAQQAGARVAIIAPTDILANQIAATVAARFPFAKVERIYAGGKIQNQNSILVGTSGLASVARKAQYVPNLLIIDEQHKLATKDRSSMAGAWTHQLEASATPIPRSIAATLFSGVEVFNLRQAPVVRQIESFVFDESQRAQPVAWMRETLALNQRAAVVYPRVEKSKTQAQHDESLLRAPGLVDGVISAAQALEGRFPGRIGMLHGKMSAEEVVGSLEKFRSGLQPLVVASTIMETGIDIADIRLLIVKDAENFGAAQLHQLRGRLARNGGAARFVMMTRDKAALSAETVDRLETVQQVTDGYALAEADMKSRGFGDLAGSAQSGNTSCAFRLLRLSLEDFSTRGSC